MSPLVGVVVLAGLVGVPLALLEGGRRYRELTDVGRAAYRGAVLGYLASIALLVVLLLRPPFIWPPPGRLGRLLLTVTLLGGPLLGALTGAVGAVRRR